MARWVSHRPVVMSGANNSSPPEKVRCHPWPEKNGLSANVWEETRWVDPLTGLG
jgi:hypothetical protein